MNEELTRDTQIETQAGSRLPRQEPREGAVSRTPGCCKYLSLEHINHFAVFTSVGRITEGFFVKDPFTRGKPYFVEGIDVRCQSV